MAIDQRQQDRIRFLMEDVRQLEASADNQRRKAKWDCIPYTARDQWRGLPKNDFSCLTGNVPVQVDPNNVFWAEYLGFNIGEYFNDAATFAEYHLRLMTERFRLFDDDVFISRRLPMWGGAPFEASMYGMKIAFFAEADPWIDYSSLVIPEREDLDRLPLPDFYKSGMMPNTIAMYEQLHEIMDSDFEILFPEYLRGPFGIATYIRGFENVLFDMADDPDYAHRLMRFIVDSRKEWYRELEKYLGRKVTKANLFNDEVNTPSLSLDFFREFVLPYEKELTNFHGGLHYYHSCGDLTRLYPFIAEIDRIDMVHKGPWSGIREAAESFGRRTPIEVVLNPQADICDKDEAEVFGLLSGFVRVLSEQRVCGYTLRANNIQKYGSLENSIEKARGFVRAARRAVAEMT